MKDTNENELFYTFIVETSVDGFRYVNYSTGKVISTQKLREIFNLKTEDDSDDELRRHIFQDDIEHYCNIRDEAESNKRTEYNAEYRINGGKKWISQKVRVHYDESGNVIEKCTFFKDITELKQKQIELEYMAYFDSVTGLYNRNYFIKRLEHAMSKIPDEGNRIQVLYMDIDNLNIVNDSFGFEKGDELVIRFAGILNKYTNHIIKVGRFNNDEFALALFNANSNTQVIEIYEDIMETLKRPVRLSNGSEVFVNISAGISRYPDGETAIELVKCADIAMYNVKQHGKNGMAVFSESMLNSFVKNVKLEQLLKNAVVDESFYLNYQPQYYSECKKLRGFEALIRWKPDDQPVSPVEFIPIAEKTGCIINIGKWVIRKALSDFAEWKKTYGYNGVISINISAIQLKEKDFARMLIDSTKEFELESRDIEIEITESVLIEDYKEAISVLTVLREYGFRISLDDFGTGFSSLSYLKEMPIDTLKIDKSFIDTILTDESTGIITDAVIRMVKKLGLETIAEGVETEEQFEYLKKINCDNIQGFLLGKPMDKDKIINLIVEENNKKLGKCKYA